MALAGKTPLVSRVVIGFLGSMALGAGIVGLRKHHVFTNFWGDAFSGYFLVAAGLLTLFVALFDPDSRLRRRRHR